MGPNNRSTAAGPPSPTSKSTEELLSELNNKITSLTEEVRKNNSTLTQVKKENAQLKETVQQQADEILELRNEINDRELHARSWSIRVINLPIPAGQETDNRAVMDTVYKELVVPILEGARANGEKPVIVRFHSRYYRSLLFKHRKNHAPREAASNNTGGKPASDRPPRMKYPVFEDLMRATFKQLKQIQADERVTSAWTVSGVIRFKVDGDNNIHKVANIYDTVEDILE
jgi:hypothetical protein